MHRFTIDISTAHYTIKISPSTAYGYFEHWGGETSGGLWFASLTRTLIDFDGVADLPIEVTNALIRAGYNSDDEWEGRSFEADELARMRLCGMDMSEAGLRYIRAFASRMIAIGC